MQIPVQDQPKDPQNLMAWVLRTDLDLKFQLPLPRAPWVQNNLVHALTGFAGEKKKDV